MTAVPAVGLPDFQALLDPALRADPYPAYRRWRMTTPIARPMDGLPRAGPPRGLRGGAARHPVRARGGAAGPSRREHAGGQHGRPVRGFLTLNPPDHTRLRGLVSKAFTRRTVERLAPRIEAITADLLGAVGEGPVDLVETVATPLPVAVISELLGIPPADRDQMLAWSHAVARALDPDFLLPPGAGERSARARAEFAGYLRELVAYRRREPGEDLLSALVRVRDEGDALTENELLATCVLLLIAGHETTVNLIGNGTLALLRNPDQLARLRSEPDLVERAVEELLRYDSPIQLTVRYAMRDAELGDVTVARGTRVLLLIGAANRDPAAFEDPDRLDVGRTPSRHLAFGQGLHFCLGAPLARLEAQIVLRALTRRTALALAGEPSWKDNLLLRGPSHLPVTLH